MPVITSINPQKNGKRVNVYLDGKFGFGIDLENFVKFGLRVEQELTGAEIENIIKKAEFQKTYDKILLFGSLRPRSQKEYRDWLRKHKVHESIHEELFNRLKRLDFLNDKKFATWWVDQRLSFKPRGPAALRAELRQKGVDPKVVDQLISESVNQEDQIKTAKKLIEKKKYMWSKLDNVTARRKMSEYLLRKGYGWDVISKIIKNNNFEED